ncbi:MAG: substrate-binding domain-containing protein [Clostridium sp.]
MLNGRKTIGIILFDITGYYQQQLVHTLSKTASKRGYNLLTFSAFTIYGSDTKNAAGEYNILHLIPYEQLDALIVCHDTFNSNEAVEELWKLVTERCQAPIISIRKKVNGCYNILAEDTDAIPAFVRHFHDVHHFDRIAFMSGPYNHPDAIFRLEKYKEAMAELGLDCPEEYIFEGDFWKNCAADAANHFMNLTNRPQAIVCANDYMALSLCKELTLQGYSVPQDIAISGFDDVRDARANVPPLTTCYVSVSDMAKKSNGND